MYVANKVILNIEYSKMDWLGKGRRLSHIRQIGSKQCVVQILEKWYFISRINFNATEEMNLYELPGLPHLRVEDLHHVMTLTLRNENCDEGKATSHSLRYGGATMMEAAGFPQYIIALYGGWAKDSKSLLRYIKATDNMVASVSKTMNESSSSNPSKRYIQDLKVIGQTNKKSAK